MHFLFEENKENSTKIPRNGKDYITKVLIFLNSKMSDEMMTHYGSRARFQRHLFRCKQSYPIAILRRFPLDALTGFNRNISMENFNEKIHGNTQTQQTERVKAKPVKQ
ncbi:hypothetical protein ACFFRR_000174 [Megaselia abdita]